VVSEIFKQPSLTGFQPQWVPKHLYRVVTRSLAISISAIGKPSATLGAAASNAGMAANHRYAQKVSKFSDICAKNGIEFHPDSLQIHPQERSSWY